jgi:hypothetical protein
MSINSEESVEADEVCASCGIAPVDDIKLKICCDQCDLVKYCSDKCRENHSEHHEEECKKRKTELHDRELFEQPEETCYGECPLCFLPLPIDQRKYTFYTCCCKTVCQGCDYAHYLSNGGDRCPFCRELVVRGDKENNKRVIERVKANDPNALRQIGVRRYQEEDYDQAIEYLKKAAELGDFHAHCKLGYMYYKGEGVEKDLEKAVHHFEKAAIGGHPYARNNLAVFEQNKGNFERATKHFIIAAKLGLEISMKQLWKHYSAGHITKEDLDATLRGHQAAIDATKSAQRDAGEAFYR